MNAAGRLLTARIHAPIVIDTPAKAFGNLAIHGTAFGVAGYRAHNAIPKEATAGTAKSICRSCGHCHGNQPAFHAAVRWPGPAAKARTSVILRDQYHAHTPAVAAWI